MITETLEEHSRIVNSLHNLIPQIEHICDVIIKTLQEGRKILIAGNGGSAADAQHFAAELTGRFVKERSSLNAIALTTDTSALTSIANDYSFEEIFSRQLEGVGHPGDVFVGISSSGNSKNVIRAINMAKEKGIYTIGLLGNDGGDIFRIADNSLIIPSTSTARIQEMHILVIHMICEFLDQSFM